MCHTSLPTTTAARTTKNTQPQTQVILINPRIASLWYGNWASSVWACKGLPEVLHLTDYVWHCEPIPSLPTACGEELSSRTWPTWRYGQSLGRCPCRAPVGPCVHLLWQMLWADSSSSSSSSGICWDICWGCVGGATMPHICWGIICGICGIIHGICGTTRCLLLEFDGTDRIAGIAEMTDNCKKLRITKRMMLTNGYSTWTISYSICVAWICTSQHNMSTHGRQTYHTARHMYLRFWQLRCCNYTATGSHPTASTMWHMVTHVGSYAANIPQLVPTLLCETCWIICCKYTATRPLLPKYTATRLHPTAQIYRK